MRRTFHSLTFIPEITFGIENISEDSEQNALKATGVKFEFEGQMRAQVRSLSEAYDGFRALRMVFGNVVERDFFNIETVVPSRFLPELLMAAPVWFVRSKRQDGAVGDQDVHYFCDLVDSDRFAYLFQMYNYKLRSFDEFQGRDIMPLPILQVVGKVKTLFDFLVIATPYHDLASEAWRRWDNTYARAGGTSWTRNIDPFLFGFLRQIPEFIFFLGRWSWTGMFPLVGDMIADTIDHIEGNKELLINIRRSTHWYKEDDKNIDEWREFTRMVPCPGLRPISEYKPRMGWFMPKWEKGRDKWKSENHTLVKFSDDVLKQFKRGTLFSWLRSEKQ